MQKISTCLFVTIIFSALFFTSVVIAKAKPSTLYFDLGENNGWVPYRAGKRIDQEGILSELVLLIEAYSGINFESVNWPMKRAEFALKKGIVDFDFVCTAWFEGGIYGNQFVISEPLFEIHQYVITLKGNKHLYPTINSTHTKTIGTIAGYFYFDDDEFVRADFRDEKSLVLALKHQRIQAIILEYESAKYWAEIQKIDVDFATKHTTGKLVIRLNKAKQAQLPAINLAIEKIKKTGQLQTILNKYGVEAQVF
ncbi:transporter substrate-binding domain-containing protein [Colwellia sp. PAMC 21821]|uniref:substrate-binding periplasmic protein n=1 Tax=Colwellia sp. PAMC 21821 TaxID=1816219 RepID=UPI0009C25A52|nr:transporter substrate-binding domain-containing protein [Colwellia sp. PAMC 21821]ARD44371.1 hypothetical protein A3Q33_08625 [Colwellia sp. PAMC 21821]